MTKLMMFITMTILSILVIGTSNQTDHPLFWLASGEILLQIVRVGLIVTLSVLLMVNPPRHILLKAAVMSISLGVICWTIISTANYTMMFTDTISLILAGISITVAALESKKIPYSSTKPLNSILS